MWTTPNAVCSHYFDSRDNTGGKSGYQGLLLGMLQQLGSDLQGIHPALQALYRQCQRGQHVHQPSNLQLENTLDVIIQQSTSTWIVLDAMDECNEEDRAYVLKWVKHISATIRVALTSRDLPENPDTVLRIALDTSGSRIEEDISLFLGRQNVQS